MKRQYEFFALFTPNSSGGYGVCLPNLPGTLSGGDDDADALESGSGMSRIALGRALGRRRPDFGPDSGGYAGRRTNAGRPEPNAARQRDAKSRYPRNAGGKRTTRRVGASRRNDEVGRPRSRRRARLSAATRNGKRRLFGRRFCSNRLRFHRRIDATL